MARLTGTCLNVGPQGPAAAYGFNLGGWQGGHAEYHMVPYADFNLLRFPHKDQAMERIKDIAVLSDLLTTGFHGCLDAGVERGSTVYIAGAGPVGRGAAAAARLLGASCIIVGDVNPARLALVDEAGYEVVGLTARAPLADQIEAILGQREVDSSMECVAFETQGYGYATAERETEAALLAVVRAGGRLGVAGLRAGNDPGGNTEAETRGRLGLGSGDN